MLLQTPKRCLKLYECMGSNRTLISHVFRTNPYGFFAAFYGRVYGLFNGVQPFLDFVLPLETRDLCLKLQTSPLLMAPLHL